MRQFISILVLMVFIIPVAIAQETMDNPAYATWSKQKPGTTVTLKTVTEQVGTKSETSMTYKLIEVKADKVILEMTSKTTVMGMEFAQPAQKMDIEKLIKLASGETKADFEKKQAEGVTSKGEETLKIGGKDFKTKWVKYKGTHGDIVVESQTWMSDDMPNMTVKLVSKATAKNPTQTSTTTMEVTEFKAP